MHPTLPHRSPSLGLALLLMLGAAAVAPAQTTRTAVSAGLVAKFPDATTWSFESSTVAPNTFVYNPAYQPWTMTGTSGIAHEGSNLMAPLLAPRGDRAAFLQGTGEVKTIYAFAGGSWRLRFAAGQRSSPASHQVLQVLIAGTKVFEVEVASGSFENYRTRTIALAPGNAEVTFRGLSTSSGDVAFVDAVELEPIARWDANGTWSPSGVPQQNDPVVIPADVEVVMRGTTNAASVTVHGELLAEFSDTTLDTLWVEVSGSTARFEVGQERAPFEQNFTLTLLGDAPAAHSSHAGTKFLMAMDGGTIDMHGSHKKSWTRLIFHTFDTVDPPTQSFITVLDRSGWAVGDEIVVAYTGHVPDLAGWAGTCDTTPYQGPRSERRTITAIDPSSGVITLSGPLVAADHGTWQPVAYPGPVPPTSWDLDQRAEVGMLTRNVRIRGSTAAIRSFGGHVMIMACCTVMPVGLGRFANVELSNMGQGQILGRYPIHWHMLRDKRPGQYLRNSSIHDSNNRAITVHGTHGILVQDNVCFGTVGHAVFLEDGVEENNSFLGNLVLATLKPGQCEQMLPHDNSSEQAQNRSPASFWISNPHNHFVGNVAADSFGTGYWFAVHEAPTGKSAQTSPENWLAEFGNFSGTAAPLGTFDGNVAHSLKMGIDIHDSIRDGAGATFPLAPCLGAQPHVCSPPSPTPTPTNPLDDDIATNVQWAPPTPTQLTRFTAWGCTTGIYSGGGVGYLTKIFFDDCVFADNGVHVQFASAETVTNSLFVHDSGHQIFPAGAPYLVPYESGNAYVVYDGPGRVFDSHFVGYDGLAAGNLVHAEFGAARRHTNHQFSGLTFAGGGAPAIKFQDTAAATGVFADSQVWGVVVRDLDGSLTGGSFPMNPFFPYPGPMVHALITNHPMLHLTSALSSTSPDLSIPTTNAWLSPFRWGHLQVRYYSASGVPGPNTVYGLQSGDLLPATNFVRRSYLGWRSDSFLSSHLPGPEMRQLPVIVRPDEFPLVAECVYEVVVHANPPAQITNGRVDISLDDTKDTGGDVARLIISNAAAPGWNPTLVVNDYPRTIHLDGKHPYGLPAVPNSPPAASTTYQLTTTGGVTYIDLRMVNPSRTHRISITW